MGVVSIELIRSQAHVSCKEGGHPCARFHASNEWATRFVQHNGLPLRGQTTLCQQLPAACEDSHGPSLFHNKYSSGKNFLHSQIGNMDQRPLNFDMPSSIDSEADWCAVCAHQDNRCQKQRCTVMPGVMADGRKLPPYAIFGCSTLPKGKLPPPCTVRTCGCKKRPR